MFPFFPCCNNKVSVAYVETTSYSEDATARTSTYVLPNNTFRGLGDRGLIAVHLNAIPTPTVADAYVVQFSVNGETKGLVNGGGVAITGNDITTRGNILILFDKKKDTLQTFLTIV